MLLSQGLDPLPARRPKCSPLCTILRYPDLAPDPKKILKVHSAPLYSNFEWGELDKKRNFLVKIFQKMPKNTSFGLFLIFCLRHTKICQNSVFLVLWESSAISEILDLPLFRTTLCRQKNLNLHAKNMENVWKIFWKMFV